MIAITTKYLSPTNSRGARIKAFTSNGHQLTIGYPYDLNPTEAHAKAAVTLARRMGWTYGGKLVSGGIKGGYVFVFTQSETFDI